MATTIHCRVTEEYKTGIMEFAESKGMTVSDTIKTALEAFRFQQIDPAEDVDICEKLEAALRPIRDDADDNRDTLKIVARDLAG